ncbi:MAG: hypothetical protein ACTS73_01090 [Arsenophonus sp. NEOnobi-MAG3]
MLNATLSTDAGIMPRSITAICYSELYRLLLVMLKLKCLKSWIRSGNGICFNIFLLLPYLKRAKTSKTSYHGLYLLGISSGDFHETLVPFSVEKYILSRQYTNQQTEIAMA